MPAETLDRIETLISKLGRSPDENIANIVEMAADVMACPCSLFAAPAAGGCRFDIISARNLPIDLAGNDSSMAALCEAGLGDNSKNPVFIAEQCETIGDHRAGWLSRLGFSSFIGHPVCAEGCQPGVLAALDCNPRAFCP